RRIPSTRWPTNRGVHPAVSLLIRRRLRDFFRAHNFPYNFLANRKRMHDTAGETAPCYNHAPLPKSTTLSQQVVLIQYSGGDMRFDDPTLYGRDDETDEYADSGAYGESLEEDLEEEEEEEEPVLVEDDEIQTLPPVREPAPVTPSGGGGGESGPAKKKAPVKKKAVKKAAKKAAKKAKKKPA